jgi:sulfatase maturation enzyme AslB (radical SAM superfamily)
MTFQKTFCPSPWFHMRITNSGTYEPCRWMSKTGESRVNFERNIKTIRPREYFQNHMADVRNQMLSGTTQSMCNDCNVMEQNNKPSGRQRQLLKIGVLDQHFEKSLASSPMRPAFDYSGSNQGATDRMPSDWQIDLGNYCNGACVYCGPESSSTLATEFLKLGLIDRTPPSSWCDDSELLDKFVEDLASSEELHYLHFLGGETVITPGFKKILDKLVTAGLSQQTVIGFTTNLTVWSDSVIELLKQFKQVHLGMSIETLTPINDYVRYPSQQDQTKKILDRWVQLGRELDWLIQLRVTPTCLTIHDLTTIYDYAWAKSIAVESCNFLDRPEFLRISVLPTSMRTPIIKNLQDWVDSHAVDHSEKIINTRDPNVARPQIVQDAKSYLTYLMQIDDESHRLPDLIQYLKLLESNRGNRILDYLPQYEELFRSQGY